MRQLPVRWPEWLDGVPVLSIGLAVVWLVAALVVQLAYTSHLHKAERELQAAQGETPVRQIRVTTSKGL